MTKSDYVFQSTTNLFTLLQSSINYYSLLLGLGLQGVSGGGCGWGYIITFFVTMILYLKILLKYLELLEIQIDSFYRRLLLSKTVTFVWVLF